MGETKWTPGPWEMDDSDTPGMDRSRFVFCNKAPEGARLAAVCYGPKRVANARLIASAPDLYEALTDAMLAITEQYAGQGRKPPPSITRAMTLGAAAIARARGEEG